MQLLSTLAILAATLLPMISADCYPTDDPSEIFTNEERGDVLKQIQLRCHGGSDGLGGNFPAGNKHKVQCFPIGMTSDGKRIDAVLDVEFIQDHDGVLAFNDCTYRFQNEAACAAGGIQETAGFVFRVDKIIGGC